MARLAIHLRFPKYIISHDGTVTSIVHKRPRDLRPIRCGEYQGFTLLNADGVLQRVYLHRLVAETFHGAPKDGEEVRHKDGIKAHCWADNLCWGSRSENAQDKVAHGTAPLGERHGGSKLTEGEVRLIRDLCRDGLLQKHAAERFGVGQMTISRIVNNKLWRHINV